MNDTLPAGWYYVVCKIRQDAFLNYVETDPYVIVAYYYGFGLWDTDLLDGENYDVKRVVLPSVAEVRG